MRRRGLVAAAAAAMLLLTAGCANADKIVGGGGSDGNARDVAVALSSDNFVDTVTKAQLRAGTSHVTLDVDAAGQQIAAVADVNVADTAGDSSMAMTMQLPQVGKVELRLVDKIVYVDMGTLTGGKFSKIDLDDPNGAFAKSFGGLTDQLDPGKSLKALDGAIKSVRKDGPPSRIDGVQAQPYKVVVDTSEMRGSLAELGGAAGARLPKTLTYRFWVGPDNLPRKLTADVAGASVVGLFSNWGEPVTVKAPPAGQITETNPLDSLPSS